MKAFLAFITSVVIVQLSFAQTKPLKFTDQKFSADTVKHTIDALTKELSLKHPGFYRYTSKDDFDHYIDSVKSTIKDSLTLLETWLKLKPIIVNIHCLHTGIAFP